MELNASLGISNSQSIMGFFVLQRFFRTASWMLPQALNNISHSLQYRMGALANMFEVGLLIRIATFHLLFLLAQLLVWLLKSPVFIFKILTIRAFCRVRFRELPTQTEQPCSLCGNIWILFTQALQILKEAVEGLERSLAAFTFRWLLRRWLLSAFLSRPDGSAFPYLPALKLATSQVFLCYDSPGRPSMKETVRVYPCPKAFVCPWYYSKQTGLLDQYR